ncbi:TPA: hypothetical protein QBF42_003944 [Escherichia coli O105:H7]|nr:hypothetical protein [Escherichia coli O105:H7]
MSTDLSKLCADFLRQNHVSQSTEKLKASHARELVAAFLALLQIVGGDKLIIPFC